MKDLTNNINIAQSLAPAARTASANGSGVDLQGYNSAAIAFHPGVITDGTHTPKVQESDDDSTYTDVAAKDLIGSLTDLASNTIQRIGYKGTKRYIRAVSTVAGATTGGVYGAEVVRGNPHIAPTA